MRKYQFYFNIKRTAAVLTALIMLCTMLPVTYLISAESPLLKNGGFEDDLDGFQTTEKFSGTIVTDVTHSGAKALKVGANGAWYNAYLYQNAQVEKNTDYVWSFWFYCDENSTSNAFSFGVRTEDGSNLLPSSVISDGGYILSSFASFSLQRDASVTDNWHKGLTTGSWKEYTVYFNSSNNTAVSLTIDSVYDNRCGYTDDWVLEKEDVTNVGELTNGSFEDGINGFKVTDRLTYSVVSSDVHTGSKAIKLGAANAWNNAFLYKEVSVAQDTDYEWHFWFKSDSLSNKPMAGIRTFDGANLLASSIVSSNGGFIDPTKSVFTQLRSADDAANWHQGMTSNTWKEYVVSFNSGTNKKVLLTLNMFYDNRSGLTDDWSLTLKNEIAKASVINGDFEDGTKGFTKVTDGMTMEVIEDPDNPTNHILHVNGGETRGTGEYHQRISVEAYTDYRWTFKFKQGENEKNDYVKVTVSNISWVSLEKKVKSPTALCDKWGIKSPNTWSTVSVIFNSGENTEIVLSINMWASTNHAYFDDWELSEYSSNILLDPGFEEGISDFTADGTKLDRDTENKNNGDYSLKISGNGTASRSADVNTYYDYTWRFYCKTENIGKVGFAVRTADGSQLLASSIVAGTGPGTASPESFDEIRSNVFESYHLVNCVGAYTMYTVTFNSLNNKKILLTCMTDGDTEIYSDDWFLSGEEAYAEETVFNSGFEDGELNVYKGDIYTTNTITTDNPHSGKYAAVITKNETLGSGNFYQTVNVKKNSEYVWKFWLRFNSSATPVGAEPRMNGGGVLYSRIEGDIDTTVEPSFAWHRIRYADQKWHQYKVVINTGDCDVIDLSLLAYASKAVIVTDDWTFEYLGPVNKSNTLLDIGFEDENMGSHSISKPAWTVTDEEAHSGTHSIRFFGRDSTSGADLLYKDKNGVISDNQSLEKNTNYRFSFWYKGTGNMDLANIRFYIYCGGTGYVHNKYYGCTDENWNYFETVFNTEDVTTYRFQLSATILGSAAFKLYVDDIRLERLVPGITDGEINADEIICDDTKNLIPDGSAANTDTGCAWNNLDGITVIDTGDESNPKALSLANDISIVKKLTLKPYGIYRFAVSYRSNKENGWSANATIGLSFDENGTAFKPDDSYSTSGSSTFVIRRNNYSWTRKGYTFCAPEDGVIYLVIKKTKGIVEIDDLTLISLTPDSVEPKDMTTISENKKQNKPSIWDTEYDFDFDWNTQQEYADEDVSDFDYQEEETDNSATTQNSGKKMLRVKKRSLVSKGNPGIPDWILVVCIVGGAVIIAGAALTTVLLVRRKRKNKI